MRKPNMYIKVRVEANQKKEKVTKLEEDTFLISVKEKAEQNRANRRVRELVAKACNVELQRVQIVTGHKHPRKIFFVRDN